MFVQTNFLQENGLLNIEKTADKWGKNGKNEEWQEKWWERYDASGFTEKCAHKWCCIDPFKPLEAGHAHVWHERYGSDNLSQKGAPSTYVIFLLRFYLCSACLLELRYFIVISSCVPKASEKSRLHPLA